MTSAPDPRPTVATVDHGGRIPFNHPSIEGREMEYIREAVEEGHTSSSGPFSALAAEAIRTETGAQDVVLTTSCTAALELAALMLDLGPDDTVVAPSFGFVTTALAFARQGARILYCDIEDTTLGLDPGHLAELLDDTVRAVVPIHYSGVGCDIEGIQSVLAAWPWVALIEDNAHGLFGRYRGEPLGSFGRFSALSFHETKNFICGEGGALVLNEAADVERAHVIFNKGTNRREYLLGAVDKYSWRDIGSSFGLSDVLAAYLYGQLEQREAILGKRRHVYERYEEALAPHAAEHGYRLPIVPDDRDQAYHMFYVLLPDNPTRDRVLTAMVAEEIHATFHYVPLHSSQGGRRFEARPASCPVTEDISGRLLRLPFYTGLTDTDIGRVVDAFLRALAA